MNGTDETEAASALRNFNIGIGRIRLRAQAHKQTALEAVEDLTVFL